MGHILEVKPTRLAGEGGKAGRKGMKENSWVWGLHHWVDSDAFIERGRFRTVSR